MNDYKKKKRRSKDRGNETKEREKQQFFDKSVSPRYISDKISYRFTELDERIDEWTRGGGERVLQRAGLRRDFVTAR